MNTTHPTSSTSKPEEIGAALDNYTAIELYADWAGERIGKLVSELLSMGLTILLTEMQTKVKKRDINEIGDI